MRDKFYNLFFNKCNRYFYLLLPIIFLFIVFIIFAFNHNNINTDSNFKKKHLFELKPDLIEYRIDIKKGDSFASVLSSIGIDYKEILEASKSIETLYKLSDLRPSVNKFIVRVIDKKDNTKLLNSVEIIKDSLTKIVCFKNNDVFETVEKTNNIMVKYINKKGTILKGSNLIEIATMIGIPYNIIDKFYDIFSFDIDFERDIYPDDKFNVLYQEIYSDKGEYLGVGELIYASFDLNSRKENFKLFRYENENGVIGYYDENAKGALKALKKTPINGARISSRYGRRKHPILGYSKSHKGVDFAAPTGTPVPAAGNGRIVARGWRGGYGNYIKIKHNKTYSTAYGHLSKFNSKFKLGSFVKAGQIIAYVGSTGMSTGPHLHYEIIKNGVQVNPLTVKIPSIENIKKSELEKFFDAKDKIEIQLNLLNIKDNL